MTRTSLLTYGDSCWTLRTFLLLRFSLRFPTTHDLPAHPPYTRSPTLISASLRTALTSLSHFDFSRPGLICLIYADPSHSSRPTHLCLWPNPRRRLRQPRLRQHRRQDRSMLQQHHRYPGGSRVGHFARYQGGFSTAHQDRREKTCRNANSGGVILDDGLPG